MTTTREDLIVAALKLLQADGGTGQMPAPEDMIEIDSILDGKLAELNRRDIYYNDDPSIFEDEFVDPLATLLANTAAPKFGQPRNPDSIAAAEQTLQSLKESTYVPGSTLAVDYF